MLINYIIVILHTHYIIIGMAKLKNKNDEDKKDSIKKPCNYMGNTFFTKDVKQAIEVMRQGGIILYPTDTIWGLGCDATNEKAVERIYQIKQRNESKAMICLVDSENRLSRYVRNIPHVAWDLLECSVRPTTLILDGATGLANNLIAEDGSVAMRITNDLFSKELCYRFQKPVVSTSANISGQPAPQLFKDINDEILKSVDYVCTSRREEKRKHSPSCIIKLASDGEVQIIRM